MQVKRSLLNRNLQFPNRGSLGCKFWIWSSSFSPPRLSVAPKIGGSVNGQQFSSPSHTRQRLALCAVLFKLFRSDVYGLAGGDPAVFSLVVSETVFENMALSGFVWQK